MQRDKNAATTTKIEQPQLVTTTTAEPESLLKGRQGHGKIYENDVIKRFHYTAYESYTDKFDAQTKEEVRKKWFFLAKKDSTRVSIKVTKLGRGAIDLGDLFRISSITEPFIFHLGIYTGTKENMNIVEEIGIKIDPKTWKKYVGPASAIESARKNLEKIGLTKSNKDVKDWKKFREEHIERYNAPTKFKQVMNVLLNREHKAPIIKMAPKRNTISPDKLDKFGKPLKGGKRIQGRISMNDFINHVMKDNADGIFYHMKNGKMLVGRRK